MLAVLCKYNINIVFEDLNARTQLARSLFTENGMSVISQQCAYTIISHDKFTGSMESNAFNIEKLLAVSLVLSMWLYKFQGSTEHTLR